MIDELLTSECFSREELKETTDDFLGGETSFFMQVAT